MIDKELKQALTEHGKKLALLLPEFYGKVSFNFFKGHCVNLNVEQSIKDENLDERNKKWTQ
jgi:hypothetical protein